MPKDREISIRAATLAQQRSKRSARGGMGSTGVFDRRGMTGDLAPFNDWPARVVDHESSKIYSYGGCRPGGDIIPTADFHCCDMQTLEWTNHTKSLKYRIPYDPFSKADQEAKIRCLPRLQSASAAFLAINGGRFMFIFGGYDPSTCQVVSDLIAINLDDLSWWYTNIEGGPVIGRIQSAMVGLNNCLYIFGGKEEFNTTGQSPSFSSFSIAEYVADSGKWRWLVCDQDYPPGLPSLGAGGKATPVYTNKKILLTSGRSGDEQEVELSDQRTVFFHVENRTFQVAAETAGDYPERIAWYEVFEVPSPQEQARFRNVPQPVGRPRKNPPNASGATSLLSPSPSVIFCTWLPRDDEFINPEFYQYLLPPEEKITCLKLKEKIWNLDLDLQAFVVVAGRYFLLGYDKPDEGAPDTAAVYNVCVEITAFR